MCGYASVPEVGCNYYYYYFAHKAVAKYCDEHVCVCVCLFVREDISGTTPAIFTYFLHVIYGRGSVLLWHGYEIERGRSNFGDFLPH